MGNGYCTTWHLVQVCNFYPDHVCTYMIATPPHIVDSIGVRNYLFIYFCVFLSEALFKRKLTDLCMTFEHFVLLLYSLHSLHSQSKVTSYLGNC
jgi:hypothetical protein